MTASLLSLALFALPALQDSPYEANWESLHSHETPAWFSDAKFGIFIHWGVYSVPSYCDTSTYSEWYQGWVDWNSHDGLERKFHEANYGADFKYREFAPMFRAELWNPKEWAQIFRRAGAKYIVITSKHHDGFCLWPNPQSSEARGYPWNSGETGPKRDLLGELFNACREEGVRPGLYYSFMEWHSPLYDTDKPRYVDEVMIPQIKELITRYEPDVFWPDGEWDHPDTLWRSPEILAWIYNNAPNAKNLAVNDRWGKGLRGQVGDYSTTEYGNLGNSSGKGMREQRPFEECRGIGHSFAFNRNEGYDIYQSRTESVRELIDLVSKGGSLLLDVGPTADGRIPLIMVDRLFAIGRWLETNGEAIYGTTKGPFESLDFGRATTKGETLYLHIYDWPEGDTLTIPGLVTPIRSARVLGGRRQGLKVTGAPREWTVHLDDEHHLEHATVLRLDLLGAPEVDTSIRPDRTGSYTLSPRQASLTGGGIRLEERGGGVNVGYWSDPNDQVAWPLKLKPGRYSVDVLFAIQEGSEGSTIAISWGDQHVGATLSEATGTWDTYQRLPMGFFDVGEESDSALLLKCVEKKGEAVMNCREVRLIKLP